MFDDISELVNETFHQSSQPQKLEFLQNKSGVIYRVDRSGQTFVIRMFISEDLAHNLKDLSDNPETYPSLRLINADDDIFNQVHHFECDLRMAKYLKSLFAGKRFPVKEEDILNVSDPGYSLWLKDDEGIEIFFKLSQITEIKNLTKLGPIAHIEDLLEEFETHKVDFNRFFEVQELAINPTSFKLRAMKTPAFKDFIQFFKTGVMTADFSKLISDTEMGRVFKRIAFARKFWLEIGKDLEDDPQLEFS